jgi:hypothetical protein
MPPSILRYAPGQREGSDLVDCGVLPGLLPVTSTTVELLTLPALAPG